MKKSSAFSGLNEEIEFYNTSVKALKKAVVEQRTRYTVAGNRYSAYCFGDMRSRVRHALFKNPEHPVELTWTIAIAHWTTANLFNVLEEYLAWVWEPAHEEWFEGFSFNISKDSITIEFNSDQSYDKLLFLTFLFRRITWHPDTIISWYILRRLNCPLAEINLLLAANFVEFTKLEWRTFSAVDEGHSLYNTIHSILLYDKEIPDVRIALKARERKISGAYGSVSAFNQLWIPKALFCGNPYISFQKLSTQEQQLRKSYDYISANW